MKISILLLFGSECYGQNWIKEGNLELSYAPTTATTDYLGNLYVGFSDGRVTKYDPEGKLLENYALANNSSITLIDAQNNLRSFLFQFDNQQITILDRFSSVPKNYRLSDFNLEISLMACPAPDGDFWVAENNPQRLKKVNPLRKTTVLEVQVSMGDSIAKMQAYQNILAVGAGEKLFIFDQFGGLLHTLTIEGLINFQIIKGVLFAFSDQSIYEINPFKGSIVSTSKKPDNAGLMLKSKVGFLSLNGKSITYYR